jgi:hypothetical protein
MNPKRPFGTMAFAYATAMILKGIEIERYE